MANAVRFKPVRLALVLSVAAVVLLLTVTRPTLTAVEHAVGQALSPSLLVAAVGGQIVSLAVCSLALRVLVPALSLRAATLSRWVRDAVGALPTGVPGLSEAAGVRILGLSGLSPSEALAVTAADVLAETLAQAAYALCALALAPLSLRISLPRFHPSLNLAVAASCAALVVAGSGFLLAPSPWRVRLRTVAARTLERVRSVRFGVSWLLHGLAWTAGGAQIFLLSRLLQAPLSLTQALSLEGLVFAARAAAFVIPAGVGVQELALAGLGGAYGLPAPAVVTLALLLRLRDVIAYTPALLIWLIGELRQALRPAPAAVLVGAEGGLNPCSR